jgi:hypothetical protein
MRERYLNAKKLVDSRREARFRRRKLAMEGLRLDTGEQLRAYPDEKARRTRRLPRLERSTALSRMERHYFAQVNTASIMGRMTLVR